MRCQEHPWEGAPSEWDLPRAAGTSATGNGWEKIDLWVLQDHLATEGDWSGVKLDRGNQLVSWGNGPPGMTGLGLRQW